MNGYLLLMHADATTAPSNDTEAAWSSYIQALTESGQFLGGSAIGGGHCYTLSGEAREITIHITGYIQVRANSLEDARRFLKGNPVFEAGGTVEIRELPRS